MVAVHVGKLHTAKELLLGQMLGNVGQVQGSLPVVTLIQVIFVLKDFLGKEGQDNTTSPACQVQFSPRHPCTHSSSWPHRQPYLSPKELQAGQELDTELQDGRRQEQSHSQTGCAWSQAFLTIKSGQQGEVTRLQTSPLPLTQSWKLW